MKNKLFLKILIIIVISLGVGFLIGSINQNKQEGSSELRNNPDNKYKFINPLLECETIENVSNKQINEIKSQVTNFIDKETSQGNLSFISVYFRDLNNGPWFGLNEKEVFTPGSLLKVPLMMSIFKIAESNPGVLEKKILYGKKEDETPQYFKPEKEIEINKTYTAEELIEAMIKYSDNNAAVLLVQMITSKQVEESYIDLGINSPLKLNEQYSMSVRTYASFFRILFNATYLNRELSEKALSILSQATFDKGLKQGVPSDIVIAHKFGEKELNKGGNKQLHDCGIIYYSKQPYILCIMSRGNDFDKLADVIKNISSIVWEEMNKL